MPRAGEYILPDLGVNANLFATILDNPASALIAVGLAVGGRPGISACPNSDGFRNFEARGLLYFYSYCVDTEECSLLWIEKREAGAEARRCDYTTRIMVNVYLMATA